MNRPEFCIIPWYNPSTQYPFAHLFLFHNWNSIPKGKTWAPDRFTHVTAEDVLPTTNHQNALQVFTLGNPKILWHEKMLHIPRRQVRALLYYLAVAPEPVSFTRLSFLFWADSPERQARRHLSHLCSSLRACLPHADLLVKSEETLGLNPTLVHTDYRSFLQAMRQEAYPQAEQLYTGEFLAGFEMPSQPEYDRWLFSERQALQTDFLTALWALAQQAYSAEKYPQAIALAQRFLHLDELDEDIHRLLIEIYGRLGERSAAMRQFERCAQLLEQELGVNPLPETRAAMQQAMRGEDSPPKTASRRRHQTKRTPPIAPLIGRQKEMQRLRAFFRRVSDGASRILSLHGEPGIGKSRLVHEFSQVIAGKALLFTTSCDPGMREMPYHLLRKLLRRILEVHPQAFEALEDHWKAEFFLLLPELRMRFPHLVSPFRYAPQEVQDNLFEAVCRLMEHQLDRFGACLLVIEDLHQADRASVACLHTMPARLQSQPFGILYTWRTHSSPYLEALQTANAPGEALESFALQPLTIEDVIAWLKYTSIPQASLKPLAEEIHHLSGGNPLYINQIILSLNERGEPLNQVGAWKHFIVQGSLKDLILHRVQQISELGVQILESMSVMGRDCDEAMLSYISRKDAAALASGLAELSHHQLIQETESGFCFSHAIILNAVYQNIKPWRRKLLHRRTAEALQNDHPEDMARVGYHYQQAEMPLLACRAYLDTVHFLKALFAFDEMLYHCQTCLNLLTQAEQSSEHAAHMDDLLTLHLEVLRQRGWVYRFQGKMELYQEDLRSEQRLNHLLQNERQLAYLRWREATTHRWLCNFPAALQAALNGMRLGRKTRDLKIQADCLRECGLVHLAMGDYPAARDELERALAIYTRIKCYPTQVHVLVNLSSLHYRNGELQRAEETARESLDLCAWANLPLERCLPLGYLGVMALEHDDCAQAESLLEESLAIAQKISHRLQELFCVGHLGRVYIHLRQPKKALTYLHQALEYAQQEHFCEERSWLHRAAAEAYALMDMHAQVLDHLQSGRQIASLIGQAHELQLIQEQINSFAA